MSAGPPTSELTTRDVLSQIDRRLTLIEGDSRGVREHMDTQFAALLRGVNDQFAAFRSEVNALFAAARSEVNDQFAAARGEVNDQFAAARGEVNDQFAAARGEVNDQFAAAQQDTNERFAAAEAQRTILRQDFVAEVARLRSESNSRFHWSIGLMLASWMSMMGTLLLK